MTRYNKKFYKQGSVNYSTAYYCFHKLLYFWFRNFGNFLASHQQSWREFDIPGKILSRFCSFDSWWDPAKIMGVGIFIPTMIPGGFPHNPGGHNHGRIPVLIFTRVIALRNLPSKLKCLRTPWIIVS